jgi:hypothetical protein
MVLQLVDRKDSLQQRLVDARGRLTRQATLHQNHATFEFLGHLVRRNRVTPVVKRGQYYPRPVRPARPVFPAAS